MKIFELKSTPIHTDIKTLKSPKIINGFTVIEVDDNTNRLWVGYVIKRLNKDK